MYMSNRTLRNLNKAVAILGIGAMGLGIFGCGSEKQEAVEMPNFTSAVLNEATVTADSHFADQTKVVKSLEEELAKSQSWIILLWP